MALLNAKTVTAVVAKRKTSGVYDRVLTRYMEIMEEEHLQFLKEVGLSE